LTLCSHDATYYPSAVKHAKHPENKSTKFQAPSSREIPSSKHQKLRSLNIGAWFLVLLWSLDVGAWFFYSPHDSHYYFHLIMVLPKSKQLKDAMLA